MKSFIGVLLLSLITAGCTSNPYAQYYTDKTKGIDIEKSGRFIIPTENPIVIRGTDVQKDHIHMMEEGYALLGFSAFNSPLVDENDAIVHAKQIRAGAVVLYSNFSHTNSGALPFTMPNVQTSNTQLSGSAFGSGGYANYSGVANTTTYGTQTMMVPYNVNRYDYTASYWIRRKTFQLGVFVNPMTDEQKQTLQSNKGLQILAVAKNSPAFFADVLRGDILRSIGGKETYDVDTFKEALRLNKGKAVSVIIYRNGQELTKNIQLNDEE